MLKYWPAGLVQYTAAHPPNDLTAECRLIRIARKSAIRQRPSCGSGGFIHAARYKVCLMQKLGKQECLTACDNKCILLYRKLHLHPASLRSAEAVCGINNRHHGRAICQLHVGVPAEGIIAGWLILCSLLLAATSESSRRKSAKQRHEHVETRAQGG